MKCSFIEGLLQNPQNGEVKALSEACLDSTYLGVNTTPENGEVKALSEACLDSTYKLNIGGECIIE